MKTETKLKLKNRKRLKTKTKKWKTIENWNEKIQNEYETNMKANKCQQSHQGLKCHLQLSQDVPNVNVMATSMLTAFDHRFSKLLNCAEEGFDPLAASACYLDPSPFLIPSHLLVLVQKLNCPTMVLNFVVVLRLPTALPLTSGRLVNLAIHCCPRSLLIYFQPRHPRHTLNVCSVSVEIWRQANATEWLLPLNDVYFLKLTRSTCEQTC